MQVRILSGAPRFDFECLPLYDVGMSYETEKNKEYLVERYSKQREEFVNYLGGRCSRCGTTENLEIDHIFWQDKSFAVSALWGSKKLEKVYAELDKCQLLCQEHHKLKTKQDKAEQSYYKPINHGTMYAWMKLKCGCEVCLLAKWAWYDERNEKRRAGEARGPYSTRK